MPDRIITAKDIARRDGFGSVRELILNTIQKYEARGYFYVGWDGTHVGGAPIMAFVDFGRWVVRCECGQHSYVDPDEPVMFCVHCGNGNNGLARPVIFPTAFREIEKLLLKRPVIENPKARNEVEGALLARPAIAWLTRNWYPGQSLADLYKMNSVHGE